MSRERHIERVKEWVSSNSGSLLKVGAAVGATIVGALMIRRHNQLQGGDYFTPDERDSLAQTGIDLTPRRAGEEFESGRKLRGTDLMEYLAPEHQGCTAIVTADKKTLLELASRTSGTVAAAYRTGDGPWTWFTVEDHDPAAKTHPGEAETMGIGASLPLGDGATEVAMGVVSTDDQNEEHFAPIDTTLVGAGSALTTMDLSNLTIVDSPEDGAGQAVFHRIMPAGPPQ